MQPEPIARPPPGTQENIINEIERGKTKLEGLIGRLKECRQTNPMRAQLGSFLESIKTQIASVSGQLDIWRVKRDEQKRFYANKLSYQDVKKKKYQKVQYVHYLENRVRKILLERLLNDSHPLVHTRCY